MSVCVSVCPSVWSLLRYPLNIFLPPLSEVSVGPIQWKYILNIHDPGYRKSIFPNISHTLNTTSIHIGIQKTLRRVEFVQRSPSIFLNVWQRVFQQCYNRTTKNIKIIHRLVDYYHISLINWCNEVVRSLGSQVNPGHKWT